MPWKGKFSYSPSSSIGSSAGGFFLSSAKTNLGTNTGYYQRAIVRGINAILDNRVNFIFDFMIGRAESLFYSLNA